jgi:hypothetical protein
MNRYSSANGKYKTNHEISSRCSIGSSLNNIKNRYPTPTEIVKSLLDSYLFNDFTPFVFPVTLILTSPKLEQRDCLEISLHSIKLITETRICPILL